MTSSNCLSAARSTGFIAVRVKTRPDGKWVYVLRTSEMLLQMVDNGVEFEIVG